MKALQYSKLKLAFGILIPVLVMVVTLTMLGVSFAWFSNSPDVYVESINLSVAEPYQIVFNPQNGGDNLKYRGQTALASDGKGETVLITAKEGDGGNAEDRAFCFAKLISLDTKGSTVDFELYIDNAEIFATMLDGDGNEQIIKPPTNSYTDQPDNLPYAFTWFFKAHEGDATQMATNKNPNNRNEMMYYNPAYNPAKIEEWYTPYGLLTFDANGKVLTVNGEGYNEGDEIVKQNIVGFSTNSAQLYDLYIVFAPEKLFWQQFFTGLESKTAQETYAYATDESGENLILKHIGVRNNQMYYSGFSYLGSSFEFSVTIDVVSLHDEENPQP